MYVCMYEVMMRCDIISWMASLGTVHNWITPHWIWRSVLNARQQLLNS